jgi:hypothetical protein
LAGTLPKPSAQPVAITTVRIRYVATVLAGITGLTHLYGIFYYNMMAFTFQQGGGWPFAVFFGAVGIGFLLGTIAIMRGMRWFYVLALIYLTIGFTLFLLGAFTSLMPASPYGVDSYGAIDKTIQVVLFGLLITLLVRDKKPQQASSGTQG